MKKTFQLLLVPALLICFFCACKKDLGNYDYTDPNVITITTDMANVDTLVVVNNDSVVVKQNDSLRVNILLSQTKPSSDLSFEWSVIQSAAQIANPSQYQLGTSQQLRTKITLTPNLYKLIVKVTDKTTGISFYKFYSLNVDTSPWGGEGWVVLQDQSTEGGCDISVITTRDGVAPGNVYSNLYSLANGKKLPMGTNKVNVLTYLATLRNQKVSFFYPNGGLQVRSADFSDSSDHTSWFLVAPPTTNLQLNGVVSGGQYEYLINGNILNYRRVSSITLPAAPIKFGAPIIGTWTLSPFAMNNTGSESYFMLYDQANKCFVHYNMETNVLVPNKADTANRHFNQYPTASSAALHPTTGSGFDLNNIGRNLVYAENSLPLGTGATYSCLFRNNANDSSWIYQVPMATSYANNFTTGRFFLSNINVPGINTATIFSFPTYLTAPGKFYYVNSNKINLCTIGTLASSTATTAFTFPAGVVIKSMKTFKSGYVTAPTTESKVLVVATDETAIGQGHKVYFLNLGAAGDISSTPARVYTGFDKIVDIAFKKGLGL